MMLVADVEVRLTVSLVCCQCNRCIARTASLEENSLRTGNTTEKALYWVEQERDILIAKAKYELWVMHELSNGSIRPLCGVCNAKMLARIT